MIFLGFYEVGVTTGHNIAQAVHGATNKDFHVRIWLKMHRKFKKNYTLAAHTMRTAGTIFVPPHFSDKSYAPGQNLRSTSC